MRTSSAHNMHHKPRKAVISNRVLAWYFISGEMNFISGEMNISEICGALRDLGPFVQFKRCEKHPWRSVNFSKVAGWSLQNRATHHIYWIHWRSFNHFILKRNIIKTFLFWGIAKVARKFFLSYHFFPHTFF